MTGGSATAMTDGEDCFATKVFGFFVHKFQNVYVKYGQYIFLFDEVNSF